MNSANWWTSFKDIPVHGDLVQNKSNDSIRFYFENIDGFGVNKSLNSVVNNSNLKYFNTLMQRLDVDVLGGVEARMHWDLTPTSHSLKKLLSLQEGSKTCKGHNTHERFSMHQQGGVFMAAMAAASENIVETGQDEESLGRWCWMKFEGRQMITRVLVAYQPCVTRKEARTATIAQQKRYWRIKGDFRCPRKILGHSLWNY